MKAVLLKFVGLADALLAVVLYPSAWVMKAVRKLGVFRMPLCKAVLLHVGVFPVRNHYYEPQFDFRRSSATSREPRPLPGIDWNVPAQLALLERLTYAHELADLESKAHEPLAFRPDNPAFGSGDFEFLYQVIRHFKPRRIIEIGSGHSTLIARRALLKNAEDGAGYTCEHICIEPFEMPWLESAGVQVKRSMVEDVPLEFFSSLQRNDILFIDSSHMVRPDGDVLFEYLRLLPTLAPGVIVHVHDIFSPRNYLSEWLEDQVLFWNEQYILEAFLTENHSWKVMAALNMLKHDQFDKLQAVAPFLRQDREPGSFYLQKQ